ncbi:hypothetical protein [Saccharopolyspora gloriosae]|uniref:hypothetical protein n=1 Tax=Saccharopolyspora gloriosae TaxID=455344 RepID=UPI001FB767F8|nr:hypothetical protein [Saccharopolyspora gloriosae]
MGVALTATLAALIYDEALTVMVLAGIALIIGGVLTQDVYMTRKTVSRGAATALKAAFAKESN